jgi:hypothetical protein
VPWRGGWDSRWHGDGGREGIGIGSDRRCGLRRWLLTRGDRRLAQEMANRGRREATLLKIAAPCDDRGMTTRRFPAPWRADKMPGGYAVRDSNGLALVYLYSRDKGQSHQQAFALFPG